MKKKACIVILALSILALLNGVGRLIEGISARGVGGVNYGGVIFPLVIGIGAVYFLRNSKK